MNKLSRGERLFELVNYVLLTLLALFFLLPFVSVLMTSFVSQAEYAQRGAFILIPQRIDLTAYRILLGTGSVVPNAYMITILRALIGTLLNLVFTATLAYGLARRQLPGRTAVTLYVFIPMIFSGGLIPSFILMDTLHLLNKFWVMIVPGLISVWNLLIMRNFFMALPYELEEAAIVDGASPPVILWKIILPLSLPSISTIGLFYAVGHWNAWFDAAIYLKDMKLMPVQLILRAVMQATMQYGGQGFLSDPGAAMGYEVLPPARSMQGAMIMVTTLPILCIYPFIQKYFVKGALIGSVKG
jgi:putative aldouronate transport system permease protein